LINIILTGTKHSEEQKLLSEAEAAAAASAKEEEKTGGVTILKKVDPFSPKTMQ
jgi:hypothetical protein